MNQFASRCSKSGLAFVLSMLLSVVGCTNAAPQPARVSVLKDADPAASALVAYLESRDVGFTKTGGVADIVASEQTRAALIRFMEIARLKMDTCAINIANQNVTRDADGKPNPYRRRMVVIAAGGEARTCLDQSPFVSRYQPGHPDAGADGMVKYPNIDLSIELVEAQCAVAEYELAAEVLRRLDSSIVILRTGRNGIAQLPVNGQP